MKYSLKKLYPQNNCYCELDNSLMNGLLIENDSYLINFLNNAVQRAQKEAEVGFAKSGFDIEKHQTILENFRYKKISKAELDFFQNKISFSLKQKISELDEISQAKVRILFALINYRIVFIDEVFSMLNNSNDYEEIVEFIRDLQHEYECLVVVCINNQEVGKYFNSLYALEEQTWQFLPLK